MRRRTAGPVAVAVALGLLGGCGEDPEPPTDPGTTAPAPGPTTDAPDGPEAPAGPDGPDEPDEAPPTDPVLRDVATGLEAPWDVVDLAGRVLVTERDSGRLLEVGDDGELREVRVFDVDPAGEGGLLGLAAGPDDELFVMLTGADDNRVLRLDDVDDGEPTPIVTGIPKGGVHNGGRLAIGPDDHLYVGTGDAGVPERAGDEGSLAGKVLRVARDGAVPDDNPFPGSPVWSLGHRNVQGLAFDADGRLWAAELGPDVDDEINRIEPGQHHGWPAVTGAPSVDGYVDAAYVAQPGEASWSGAATVTDPAVPGWEGELFVTALRGERLWRFTLDGDRVAGSEQLLAGELGRIRTVRPTPDGSLWLLTTNRDGRGAPRDGDDRLVRYGPP